MTKISKEFLVRLKFHPLPAYRLAQAAGVDPTKLSKLINGIENARPHDDRLLRVGQILGLRPDEIFDEEQV